MLQLVSVVRRPSAVYLWEVWLHLFYAFPLDFNKVIFPLPSLFKADLTALTQLPVVLHVPQPLYHLGGPQLDLLHCQCISCIRESTIEYSTPTAASQLPNRREETSPLTCWPHSCWYTCCLPPLTWWDSIKVCATDVSSVFKQTCKIIVFPLLLQQSTKLVA